MATWLLTPLHKMPCACWLHAFMSMWLACTWILACAVCVDQTHGACITSPHLHQALIHMWTTYGEQAELPGRCCCPDAASHHKQQHPNCLQSAAQNNCSHNHSNRHDLTNLSIVLIILLIVEACCSVRAAQLCYIPANHPHLLHPIVQCLLA